MYCDFKNDGWTLLATFEQPEGFYTPSIPLATYNSFFSPETASGLWIHGNSHGQPLQEEPLQDGSWHFKSQNWNNYLHVNKTYQLRQKVFKGKGSNKYHVFDVAHNFTYTGYTDQNSAPDSIEYRAWRMTNRYVIEDTTGIPWDIKPEIVNFWLPFSSGATGNLFTACAGFSYDTGGCYKTVIAQRRFGDAGIIGSTADASDPGMSWAPHTNTENNFDIALAHQSAGIYGSSGAGIVLAYWIRGLSA